MTLSWRKSVRKSMGALLNERLPKAFSTDRSFDFDKFKIKKRTIFSQNVIPSDDYESHSIMVLEECEINYASYAIITKSPMRTPEFHGPSKNHTWVVELLREDDIKVRLCLKSRAVETPFYAAFCFAARTNKHNDTSRKKRWLAMIGKTSNSDESFGELKTEGSFIFSKDQRATPFYSLEKSSDWVKQYGVQFYFYFSGSVRAQVNPMLTKVEDFLKNPAPRPSKYTSDVMSLLRTGQFSDFCIEVGDKKISCHKIILSCRSPYFEAMFKSNLSDSSENKVKVTDFTADVIEAMVIFLYTSKLPEFSLDTAMELLRAADKYEIPDLKEICEECLIEEIDEPSALNLLLGAEACCAEKLKKAVVGFICSNSTSFKQAAEYEPLEKRPDLLRYLMQAKANSE